MDEDAVFKALGDRTRRRLLDSLRADNGQTLGSLCADLAMTRQGVSQHLERLEAAELVVSVRRGREKLHYLNPVPIHEIHVRWIAPFERRRLDALHALKTTLEGGRSGQARVRLRHLHRDDARQAVAGAPRR